jgi:hypothetical protein
VAQHELAAVELVDLVVLVIAEEKAPLSIAYACYPIVSSDLQVLFGRIYELSAVAKTLSAALRHLRSEATHLRGSASAHVLMHSLHSSPTS